MGQTAENLVDIHKISREDQDAFAYHSQMKATEAQKSGRLSEEIIAVEIPQRKADPIVFAQDEFVKPTTSLEVLGKLRSAFKKDGSVTAGNSSVAHNISVFVAGRAHCIFRCYSQYLRKVCHPSVYASIA